MARISQNPLNKGKVLPDNWDTREELVNLLLENQENITIWKSNINESFPDTPSDFIKYVFMKNSWQLTSWGAIVLSHISQFWLLENSDNVMINGRALINMGKIINGPWYHRGRHVYVWNEFSHFEMQMFDGSIRRFIDFYKCK